MGNGFLLQIFDLFDVKRKGVIDFGDFVRSLNVFHPNAPQEDKINCKLPKAYIKRIILISLSMLDVQFFILQLCSLI